MTDLILTSRMVDHPADSHTIARYVDTGGYTALDKALSEMTPEAIIAEVKASNMRGRGGAGFPTGVKWGFLAPAEPRYLVVNGDESEPGTFKDRQLLERDPHQLVEGIIISSYALNVHHAFVYIRGEYPKPARRVQRAIDEAYEAGYLGEDIRGTGFSLDITVHLGGGAYICGEETALLNSLEGRRGEPRLKPPFPAVEGLYAKPTIVNNVESISNIPWMINNSGLAYAAIGPERSAGTRMFSLSGHVERPGNYEIVMGMTWRDLIYDIGGGIPDGRELKAWIPGGASAPWFV
ncbi:NADH-ubiquinone oxidoreductase chain F, partial [hydrothermal vent metagenome]